MKIKILILLFGFIIFPNQIICQTIKVDYHRITYKEYDGGKNLINPTELFLSTEKSYFIEDRVIEGKTTNVPLKDYNEGNYLGIKIAGDSLGRIIIKDLPQNKFYQRKNSSNFKPFAYRKVVDSILPSFNWNISDENKTILGYITQKAETVYNDRKIIVWFSPKLAFNDGPWKFQGLPGLILEAKIEFEALQYMVYKAIKITSIEKLPKLPEINDPEEQLSKIESDYYNKAKNNFKYLKTISDGQLKIRLDDLDFKPIIFENN